MSKKFPRSEIDLRNPIFHDDDKAREHLETVLWPQGPGCPRCGVMDDRITKLQGKSTRPGVYKCKDCRKPFSVTVGTVMERSHIPVSKWVMAAHLMAASKKGMSALQLHRMLQVSYETAWFLFHRLRECANDVDAGPLGGPGMIIEADTTFIGGKEKNKHLGKRKAGNIGGAGKAIVHTLVERGGRAKSHHIANVSGKTLRRIVTKHASRKSKLMTDTAGGYMALGKEFASHEMVNHEIMEYVRDGRDGAKVHSNTVEGFFALLKRGVYGSFHNISEAHLHRYLAEFDFRYSNRKISDAERAALLLKGATGKRLMYRQPDQAANA